MSGAMPRDPLEANSCTVELSTGSLIEVAEPPKDVLYKRDQILGISRIRCTGGGTEFDMLELTPLIGGSRSDAEYRARYWVDPRHIIAVYPLDERPIPPRRVYVDRIEARDKQS